MAIKFISKTSVVLMLCLFSIVLFRSKFSYKTSKFIMINIYLLSIIVLVKFIHTFDDWTVQEMTGNKQLDENYFFSWKTDPINKQVTFKVVVQTKGWIGFGLSSNGKMTQSDLVIGWVTDQGKPYFNDYWVDRYERPSVDKTQDWFLESSYENSSHTVLEFHRKYKTCDELEDLDIHENLYERLNIIWAYSENDPVDLESISKHDKQGVFYVNLFEREEIIKETDVQVIDLTLDQVSVPFDKENYYQVCKFVMVNFSSKTQIIKQHATYEPSGQLFIAHLNLFKCSSRIFKAVEANYHDKLFLCREEQEQSLLNECEESLAGGTSLIDEPFVLPEDTAWTFEPEPGHPFSWLLLIGVFKNTKYQHGVTISASLRLWITHQFRKYETSNLLMGPDLDISYWSNLVPPKQAKFVTVNVVDTYCFEQYLDEQGIFIFSTIIHTYFSEKINFKHYRHGQLIGDYRHNYYSFDDQHHFPIRPYLNLKKKDKLLIICITNTTLVNRTLLHNQEACYLEAAYFPKIDGFRRVGLRITYRNMLKLTGLEEIEGYSTETMRNTIIRRPEKFNNTTLYDFITQNLYRMDPGQLQHFLVNSNMLQSCYFEKEVKFMPKPRIIKKLPGILEFLRREEENNTCSGNELGQISKV